MILLQRQTYNLNTEVPIVQTAVAVGTAYALGRLGHLAVYAFPTVAVQAGIAATVAAIACNIFKDNLAKYAATVASVAFSCVVFSGNGLNVAANAKLFAVIAAALVLVRAFDQYVVPYLGDATKKVADKAADATQAVADATANAATTVKGQVDSAKAPSPAVVVPANTIVPNDTTKKA